MFRRIVMTVLLFAVLATSTLVAVSPRKVTAASTSASYNVILVACKHYLGKVDGAARYTIVLTGKDVSGRDSVVGARLSPSKTKAQYYTVKAYKGFDYRYGYVTNQDRVEFYQSSIGWYGNAKLVGDMLLC